MRIVFGPFTLDSATRQLLRAGRELHLEPKALELLQLLIEARPAAVSKSRIRDQLWPRTFVSEASLTRLVAQIRRALEDVRTDPRFIRTVHGYGYAFDAETSGDPAPGDPAPGRAAGAHRVIWEQRVIPLAPGPNLIGRDEAAVVRIDAPGVSRRHAHILVVEGRATLEDLGSKNGTYFREQRLDAVVRLEDGDHFRVGRHLLTYRCVPLTDPTVTEGAS